MEEHRTRLPLRLGLWVLATCAVIGCSDSGGTVLSPAPGSTSTPNANSSASASPTGTPTPEPTATPTPGVTPTPFSTSTPGTVTLSTYELDFASVGAAAAQTTMASETFYVGPFGATTTNCSGIASISGPDSSNTFTITPQNNGICAFAIAGGNGASATLDVTVTLTSGTVKARPRGKK